MRRILTAGLLIAAACGCRRAAAPPAAPEGGGTNKSTMATVIDGATGRTAIRAGQHAKEEIRRISAEQDAQMQEVLGP